MIKLIVGIGNPGAKYQLNRHNIGFLAVDEIARSLNANFNQSQKFDAQIAKVDANLTLMKPMGYVNLSGISVGSYCRYYKIEVSQTLVLHDELDLDYGVLRIKKGGSDAGHNGLISITEHLQHRDYWRLRFGIGRPLVNDATNAKQQTVISHVLSDFSDEQKLWQDMIERSLVQLEYLRAADFEPVMALWHKKHKQVEKPKAKLS